MYRDAADTPPHSPMPSDGNGGRPDTSNPGEEPPRQGIFFGWYVVAGVFVLLAVTCGFGFYNLSVFLEAFQTQTGLSVELISLANAFFFISSALSGLVVAALMDKYDTRYVIGAGIIVNAVVLALVGYVSELWQLFAFYIIFGAANAATTMIPGPTLVARWFVRKRSQAIAYASTGFSMGGVVCVPISSWLIAQYGLGGAGPYLGAMYLFIPLAVTLFLLRPNPQSMGLGPDGDPIKLDASGKAPPADGIDFSLALKSRFFILFSAAYVLAMLGQVGTLVHLFHLVALRVDSPHVAATAVSVMAAFSIAGRVVGGTALNWISSKTYLYGMLLLQMCSYLGLALVSHEWSLFIAAAAFGITVGNLQMLMPLMIAEAFGLKAYARILSVNQMLTTLLGNACGPAVIGVLFTVFGGYQVPYLLLSALPLLALFILIAAGSPGALLAAQKEAEQADRMPA